MILYPLFFFFTFERDTQGEEALQALLMAIDKKQGTQLQLFTPFLILFVTKFESRKKILWVLPFVLSSLPQ